MKFTKKLGLGIVFCLLTMLFLSLVTQLLPPAKVSAAPEPVEVDTSYNGDSVTVSCIGNLRFGSYSSVANMVNDVTGTPPSSLTSFLYDIANSSDPADSAYLYVANQLTDNPNESTGYVYFSPAPGETDSRAADICMRSGLYFSRPDDRRTFVGFEYNEWDGNNVTASARAGRQGNTINDEDLRFFSFGQGLTVPSRGVTRVEVAVADDVLSNPYFNEIDPGYDDPSDGEEPAEGAEDTSCESHGGPLGWILCPLINGLDMALGWMDTRIQAILAIDENKYKDPALHQAWVQIRNLAYLILIPIMLVMVIGTALGFEVFSAYTIKKALPRMVLAVIFITFSWSICILLITFANVVGGGVVGLITAPFAATIPGINELTLSSLFGSQNFAESFIGTVAVGAGVYILLTLFLGTVVMTMLISFGILLLRQLFIVGLTLLAPLAILAWIFPGNDKLWKLWWGVFSKLLMMFPLIMGVIALGRVFAWLIMEGGAGFADAVLTPLMAVIAYVIPYAFIPFTFRLAGGIFANLTGMVNDRSKGLFDKSREKRAQKLERKGRRVLQARAGATRGLETLASKKRATAVGRFAARRLARGVGGYNLEGRMSALNAQLAKESGDQIASGKDDDWRGLTVNIKAAKAAGALGPADADGNRSNGLMRQTADGRIQYQSLGGAWIDEANVKQGHARWGKDRAAQQAAVSYEMRKAMTEEQVGGVSERYAALAKDQWGMSDNEAAGAWIGAGFENQNQHIEFKNTDWQTGQLSGGGKKMVDEIYEKKGSYPLAQMSSHTIERLKEAHVAAVASGDVDTQQKIAGIAETFMHELGGGRVGGTEEAPEFDADGAPTGKRTVSTPGAAHVAERARELAELTGVGPSGSAPSGFYSDPDHAPTPNERGQK